MLDVNGSLKTTKIKQSHYVIIEEMLANAIDSYLLRKNSDQSAESLSVSIKVDMKPFSLLEEEIVGSISCEDNGAGFPDKQIKAFVTKDTTFKDNVKIDGLAECRGSGRVQYFHYFKDINIESKFLEDGKAFGKNLAFSLDKSGEISEDNFKDAGNDKSINKTIISLSNPKEQIFSKVFKGCNLSEIYEANSIGQFIKTSFLRRFLNLQDRLGNFSILIDTNSKKVGNQKFVLNREDLPAKTKPIEIQINYEDTNSDEINRSEQFFIHHYSLSPSEFNLRKNAISLCAKGVVVKDITDWFLHTTKQKSAVIDNNFHLIFVESSYLDAGVNRYRSDFDKIPKNAEDRTMLDDESITMEKIKDKLINSIRTLISLPKWKREDVVEKLKDNFGISDKMLSASGVKVTTGESEITVAKRVLKSLQDTIVDDTDKLNAIEQNLYDLDPSSDEYREKLEELAWQYTSSLEAIDMANLSQLVIRRNAVLNILSKAISENLSTQLTRPTTTRKNNESIIHNIFFPMREDSESVGSNHDIWILGEDYQYFDYIASDIELSKYRWFDDTLAFESDIDDELKKVFQKNNDENKNKRPDIAIFSKEGSVVIIEFKAPGVNLDEHVDDLQEYAILLTSKSKGNIKKVYGYIFGDKINMNRVRGYTRFPSGDGWFNTEPLIEPETGQRLGEIYSEILFYPDIVSKAEKRLSVYRDKLGI